MKFISQQKVSALIILSLVLIGLSYFLSRPTANWKTSLIPDEKLYFNHPQDWELKTNETPPESGTKYWYVLENNGFRINLLIEKIDSYGARVGGGCGACDMKLIDSFVFDGKEAYILVTGWYNQKYDGIYLSSCSDKKCLFDSKNVVGKIDIYVGFLDPKYKEHQSPDLFSTDHPNVEIIKNILKSLRYKTLIQITPRCKITGCSGQICAEKEVITTCEFKDEYVCYKNARCEKQSDGKCGWTQTPELTSCLNKY